MVRGEYTVCEMIHDSYVTHSLFCEFAPEMRMPEMSYQYPPLSLSYYYSTVFTHTFLITHSPQ